MEKMTKKIMLYALKMWKNMIIDLYLKKSNEKIFPVLLMNLYVVYLYQNCI